jgi:predicted ATPase
MPALDKITIKGFKSIRSMEGFELKPLNVLIGANGAGKSNFIGVFKLLNEMVQENLQVFVGKSGGADRLLHYGHKTTETIYIHLQFGQNAYECTLTAAGDSLIFEEENVYYHDPKYPAPYQKRLRTGYKESVLPERAGEREAIAEYVLAAMQGWKIYHFHDTGEAAKIKK